MRLGSAAGVVALTVLAGCGEQPPEAGEDGRVDATPQALAAVVIDHVDSAEPRRTTGRWSDWADPLGIEAQVDYGVDPEGTEDGKSHTVRVDVTERAAYSGEDEAWLRCRPVREQGRCEESRTPDGRMLLYRWSRGYEEEEGGTFSWTVVGEEEVVRVGYDDTDLFETDPRGLDLPVDSEDLRAAALDPAMSLRTSSDAYAAGEALDHYVGVTRRPEPPEVVPATPRQIAERTLEYVGLEPTAIRPSTLDDFGPDAVGVHLEFPAGRRYDAFTLDVLTTVGRVPQIDPLPCRVQDTRGAAERACFAWDDDTAATWTLATGDRPGRLWVIGAQDDDTFNRVESVGILVTSSGIDRPPFADGSPGPRLPDTLIGDLGPFTSDLSVGPERRIQPD